ncbi:bifunctional UDP-N-acetylglucosamine pyrophosphorylase/glucosamine-1-phosphate N-acetyltransferase [Stella humosa]|uniref:Bifunctional protein GlmU n=1 Tax=Stella humosa TaxID=94 RepID=A0A3N1M7K4_9PROT|nr:bifunctional UDP-N-acetylglucosamine diphosphorylase/glucosamine-1-phosphate N-acetyltransferase GlmU [Stella humosa]ROP99670.1 bifunctional UDP-N-acetylglucosamine pyrophosphorylase/glucosamine-1-phosphate N-acetyltransferase [Stella humosa]BBK31105.1 bifunctional protein GlmU [Stella humosa]
MTTGDNRTTAPTLAIVLAAGEGTRMRSTQPKVMHKVAGRTMVGHVLDAVAGAGVTDVVVVVGPGMEALAKAVAPHPIAIQQDRRGTAHAVLAARDAIAAGAGDVLVVFGDTPLVSSETIGRLLAERRQGAAVAVLGFRPADPSPYGRFVLDADGGLARIVEAKDATEDERRIGLCNAGLMAIDGARALDLLDRVGCDNAKGEFYLTDLVAVARAAGAACRFAEAPVEELMGVNTRADLAAAEAAMQDRLRRRAMAEGTTLVAPETVFLAADTRLGRDTVVHPHVVFGPGVTVGEGVEIRAFSHLEQATVGDGAIVGPYARLRPGAELGAGAHVGNFVEIKAATLGPGAKANHLAYIGDATVGAGANIGAGTITCNYDGFGKYRTEIGAGAFIGSNTALVAPVSVGAGAIVGAGSVITETVPDESLAIGRSRQATKPGVAPAYRALRRARREGKV